MTMMGKFLVMTTLVLSLGMMTWGFNIYAHRIDWSDQKGKDGAPDGELVARQARAKELNTAIAGAEARWREARAAVVALEDGTTPDGKDGRVATRTWYENELQVLVNGGPKGDQTPRAIKFNDKTQRIDLDDTNYNRPKMAAATDRSGPPGKPLRTLEFYNKTEGELLVELAKEQMRLDELIKQDIALTNQIVGDANDKGLQQRIKDERVKHENLGKEGDLIKPALINTYVDSDLLLKRKRHLEARLAELKKAREAAVAARP